jgi:hypothetical protein
MTAEGTILKGKSLAAKARSKGGAQHHRRQHLPIRFHPQLVGQAAAGQMSLQECFLCKVTVASVQSSGSGKVFGEVVVTQHERKIPSGFIYVL